MDFQFSANGELVCNNKVVQVVPSFEVKPHNRPPINFNFDAIGIFSFTPVNADFYIFSFFNQSKLDTECAVIPEKVFAKHLSLHKSKVEVSLKLILSSHGLFEYRDTDGAEYFFMGVWLDNKRNLTKYYNNWSVFE